MGRSTKSKRTTNLTRFLRWSIPSPTELVIDTALVLAVLTLIRLNNSTSFEFVPWQVPVALFWFIIGALGYVILWLSSNFIEEIFEDLSVAAKKHRSTKRLRALGRSLENAVFRGCVATLITLYLYYQAMIVLDQHSSARHLSLPYMAATLLYGIISLHLLVILLRLLLLKRRVLIQYK